jgi:exopolysaccharide production protein ExoQ
MNDIIPYIVFPILALLLGVGAVGGIVLATGLAVHWRRWAFPILMVLTSIASIGAIVFSGRRLKLGDSGLENIVSTDMASGIAAKLLLVGVIACAVALCAARLFDMNRKLAVGSRYQQRGVAVPTDITIAFMCFYVALAILPILFTPAHYFHVKLIYPFFINLAIFLWLPLHQFDPIRACKAAAGLIVVASLGLAIVQPDAAIQPGYGGLIPGFNVRLWGATAHANSLGGVTAGFLLFEMAQPVRRRWLHWLLIAVGGVCLVLSQSKTSIMCVFVGAVIMYGTRSWHYFNRRGRDYNGQGGVVLAALFGIGCVLLLIFAAWVMFGDGSLLRSIERRLDSRAVGELSSGTGRLWIWAAALDAGLQSPLFGQGADYWNLATQRRLGMNGAVTAHNQYLQAFSISGLCGLVTLLVFLGFLVRYAIRGAKSSDNATIAMLVVLLLRSMFELPLAPYTVLAADFFATMGYIIFIIDRGALPLAAAAVKSSPLPALRRATA